MKNIQTVELCGYLFRIQNGFCRIMSLRDPLLDDLEDPEAVWRLSKERNVPADILTFSQHLPDLRPKYNYHMEWDNIAAVPITSYEEWIKRQVHPNTRNKIYKAQRAGVKVSIEYFDLRLAKGMVDIFNETAIRRGRRYSYYGKNLNQVEKEWSTDLDRSDFLVAYFNSEMIGFIKLVYGKNYARTSGTIAKLLHRDKAPMNALFAKAVEICSERNIPYLVYGKFIYGKKGEDSLTSFKRNNGFQRIDIPRYFIPLSPRGKLALNLGLHRGITQLLPSRIQPFLHEIRALWYDALFSDK